MNNNLALSLVIGYFLGSIPFTQIIAKTVKGIDLREVGSKNVGGRNTVHSVGLGWGIFAGTLDAIKPIAAMMVSQSIGVSDPQSYYAGLAALTGHNWPVWLGFKGGKGLAVIAGMGMYAAFPETFIGFLLGLLILKTTKNVVYTTFGGLITVIALTEIWQRPQEVTNLFWAAALIVLIAAMPNIIKTFKSPGGFKSYFDNPNEDYDHNPD